MKTYMAAAGKEIELCNTRTQTLGKKILETDLVGEEVMFIYHRRMGPR